MNRETIKVNYDGNEFEFIAVPNLFEEEKIKQKAVELIGGWENYAGLEESIKSVYSKHLELNENKFGAEVFEEKRKRLLELEGEGEATEEYSQLFEEINGNVFYGRFAELVKEKIRLTDYGFVMTMLISPKNYCFDNVTEPFLRGLVAELKKGLSFFREKRDGLTESDKPRQAKATDKS